MARSKSAFKKPQRPILVVPDKGELAQLQSRLEPVEPLDLGEIVEASNASSDLTPESILETRTTAQIEKILGVLGFPDQMSLDWERAFCRLAEVLLGVGHVVYTPRRQNRSAAKWDEAEIRLLGMMHELTEAGCSEREAIDEIAGDPKRWRRLPYEQRARPRYGGMKERSRRAIALRQQLNRIKKKWGKRPIERAFGLTEAPKSALERKLWECEMRPLIGKLGGDKRIE